MAGHNKTRSFGQAHGLSWQPGQLHARETSELVKHLTVRAKGTSHTDLMSRDSATDLAFYESGCVMAIPVSHDVRLAQVIELAQRLRAQSPLNVVAVATAYDDRMPARKAQQLLDMGLMVVPTITDRAWRGMGADAIAQDFVKRTVAASRKEQDALLASPH